MTVLARCLPCDRETRVAVVRPFGSAKERAQWKRGHTKETGHDDYWETENDSKVDMKQVR